MVDVLIVDDHLVVRCGIRHLLLGQPNLNVVGEAGTVGEAVELTLCLKPDVVLMDVRLPDGSGVDACRQIIEEKNGTKVIMLTSFSDDDEIFGAITAGASGYILKQADGDDIIEAIETVSRGKNLFDSIIVGKLMQRIRNLSLGQEPQDHLIPEEKRIVRLIAEGMTNREIGKELGLTEKTVKNYVSNIFRKLNVSNRAEAAVFAAKYN